LRINFDSVILKSILATPKSLSMDQTRAWKAVLVLLLGLATVTALSLALGSVPLSLQQLSQALLHQGEALPQTILWQLRFPRGLAAIVVGAALGTSGALMQGLLRNPLATPFLLGISAGAGLVVVAIVTLSLPPPLLPVGAWCGSVVAAAIVYALGRSSMGLSLERLILGGVSVSTLFSAIQTNLLLRAEEGRTQLALNWLFGSLSGRGWSDLQLAGPYILIALILACLVGRSLNVLNLGDDMAVGLGIALNRTRLLIGGIATLLTAGAVSISGLIAFIGLLVPHGVRLLIGGSDYRWLVPLSALGGAVLLTGADLLARLGGTELPVGAVTALIGSPLFIWLLYQRVL